MKPTKAHSSQEGQRRPTKRKQGPGVFFLIFFIRFTDNHGPKRRRRVVCLGRFIGSASICPPPPPTSLDDSLDGSPGLLLPSHHCGGCCDIHLVLCITYSTLLLYIPCYNIIICPSLHVTAIEE